jgi:hypothetical protein
MTFSCSEPSLFGAVPIVAESLHGTVREQWLKPALGDLRARQMCVFTGMVIILGIAYRFIHWIQADTPRTPWLVGLMWCTPRPSRPRATTRNPGDFTLPMWRSISSPIAHARW